MTDESRALHRKKIHGSTSTGSGSSGSSRQELCPWEQGHAQVGPCRSRSSSLFPSIRSTKSPVFITLRPTKLQNIAFWHFPPQILLVCLCQAQLLGIHVVPAPPGNSPKHLGGEWGSPPRKILPFTSLPSLSKGWNFTSLCNSMDPTPKDQLLLHPTQGQRDFPGLPSTHIFEDWKSQVLPWQTIISTNLDENLILYLYKVLDI